MNKKILASFAKSCNNDQAAFGAEIKSPSSSGQDAALSRLKHGFDSRWGHHKLQVLLCRTFFVIMHAYHFGRAISRDGAQSGITIGF